LAHAAKDAFLRFVSQTIVDYIAKIQRPNYSVVQVQC